MRPGSLVVIYHSADAAVDEDADAMLCAWGTIGDLPFALALLPVDILPYTVQSGKMFIPGLVFAATPPLIQHL